MRDRGELFKPRNVVVPFDQGGHRPESADRIFIKRPDLLADRVVVGIQEVGAVVAVPRKVKLCHALDRDRVDVLGGVEVMVEGVHVNVVDVQQVCAVGLFSYGP
jgi:hypothetical protein